MTGGPSFPRDQIEAAPRGRLTIFVLWRLFGRRAAQGSGPEAYYGPVNVREGLCGVQTRQGRLRPPGGFCALRFVCTRSRVGHVPIRAPTQGPIIPRTDAACIYGVFT